MVVSVGLFLFFIFGRGGGADALLLWGRSECDGVELSVAEEPIGGYRCFVFVVGGVLMRL